MGNCRCIVAMVAVEMGTSSSGSVVVMCCMDNGVGREPGMGTRQER